MLYFFGPIVIVLIVVIFLLIILLNLRPKYKQPLNTEEESEEEKNIQYHEEKFKKLSDHHYRAIEFKQRYDYVSKDYNIVGFQKPHGKWSKMVMKQNMQYLSTLKNLMGNNFSKMGIWELKVKAQNLISQAFHKGKGR